MGRDVYLVVPTDHVGGAEKRLIKIWLMLYLEQKKNLFLVVSRELLLQLKSIPEFSRIEEAKDAINTELVVGGATQALENLCAFAEELEHPSTFHYVLLPPIRRLRCHRYIFTFPSSSFGKYNWKGLITCWLGFLRADVLDVLSPSIYRKLKVLLPGKEIYLTPGSFVDFDVFKPKPYSERKNQLVFLGLLSYEKQADRLLRCLPDLDQMLKDKGHKDLSYRVLGRESPDFKWMDIKNSDSRFLDLDLKVEFDSAPEMILNHSKIFFSLQRADNYPSKSLLEAMACGNLAVVTDVGDTPMIAPKAFCEYVPEKFSVQDLFSACDKILSLDDIGFEYRSRECQKFIRNRFSIQESIRYFKSLYGL